MRLKPTEVLILFECALAAVFGVVFRIPLKSFILFLTNLREGGITWLAVMLGLEIALLPVFFLLVRTLIEQISLLLNVVQAGPGIKDLQTQISAGWKREGEALLRGLSVFRDWFPLLVMMGIYWTVSALSERLKVPIRDPLLAQWDLALFGSHYSVAAQRFYSPALTAFMDFCYFMHVIIFPLFLCLLYFKKQYALFDRTLFFVFLCMSLGALGYVFLPAYGPYVYLHDLYTVELVRNPFVAVFVDISKAPKDAFPSMHVALSSGLLIYQYRYAKWLFWLLLPLVVGNWISTIYLRYHYTVDLPAGFAVAAIAYWATEKTYAVWEAQ